VQAVHTTDTDVWDTNDIVSILFPGPGAPRVRMCTMLDNKYVSAIDLIRAVSDDTFTSSTGRKTWERLKEGITTGNIRHHKFPGQGQRETPVVDADAAIMLVFHVPGKVATDLRLKFVDVLKRHFAGDATLAAETAANAAHVPEATREFLAPKVTKHERALKRKREDEEMAEIDNRIADIANRTAVNRMEAAKTIARIRMEAANDTISMVKTTLGTMGIDPMTDPREKISFHDYSRRVLHKAMSSAGMRISGGGQQQLAVEDDAGGGAEDQTTEISIPLIVARMGRTYSGAVAQSAGMIGKKMAALYRHRHGTNVVIPKRKVMHQNRPILENAYTEADTDLMEQAITECT